MDRVTRVLPFNDSSGKLSFKTMFSYVFDYAIIVALAVAYAALDKLVTPFSQQFSLSDISIQYPYAVVERISIAKAVLISGGFPIVVIIIYTLVIDGLFSHTKEKGFKKYTFKQRLWELNLGILGLLLAQGTAFCITGTLKNLIGRPRPDLISRCIPDPVKISLIKEYELATKDICTQLDPAIMQDAFRSWPSGHSSSSFAGLGYLSLYLAGKLHIMDQRGEVWRTFIILIPLLAAACIAASRIMDYRHHSFDVLFGSALGLVCAWAAYRQYFPPLSHVWMKGRAYPMREWGVALKRPDDFHGTGYSSGRGERSGDTMSRRGAPEELPFHQQYPQQRHEEYQMYGMGPSRGQMRPDLPSPGFEHVTASQSSPGDDTDYEVVRSKAQVGDPSMGVPRQGTGGNNVFRDQIHKIQTQRRPSNVQSEDGEDLGAGHRSLLVGPNKV